VTTPTPLRLAPDLRARPWGGTRLAALVNDAPGSPSGIGSEHVGDVSAGGASTDPPGSDPIGEAWLVWDGCRVVGGEWAGRTLAQVVSAEPLAMLGTEGAAQADGRFPLLVKILDTADWLSLQVHPDDVTAARLEGPGHLGKTESWYAIDAAPGAELILGALPGTADDAVRAAILGGTLDRLTARVPVHAGDTVLVRAGLLHSIGPGVLLYELQQSSDLTYRVSDWGRPPSPARPLHTAKSLDAVVPSAVARPVRATVADDGRTDLSGCEKFAAELVAVHHAPAAMDTGGRSFHAVTALAGRIVVEGAGWSEELERYASILVPATTGRYAIRADGGPARAVVARVP
jgi:mannose-6-phosphate isomerase